MLIKGFGQQTNFTLGGGAQLAPAASKNELPFYTPLPAPFPCFFRRQYLGNGLSELLEISCVHCPISGPFANQISINSDNPFLRYGARKFAEKNAYLVSLT